MPGIGMAALLAHLALNFAPVARAGLATREARAASDRVQPGPYDAQPAYSAYMRAAEADPLDATPRSEAAAYLAAYAATAQDRTAALNRAMELINQAIDRDPNSTSRHRRKLHLCRRAFEITGKTTYLHLGVGPAERVVDLYPQSPDAHSDLGSTLLDASRESGDFDALSRAVEHLNRALELDDSRPEWEQLRRLSDRRRQEIKTQILEASRLRDGSNRG
jgi:tetratricopeptide (TPR) repeat protein